MGQRPLRRLPLPRPLPRRPRAGIDGAQSGLWAEMFRVACELRPDYLVVENVRGLVTAGLDEFSETWPAAGSMRNGTVCQLRPLAPRTSATGSGLWPTPVAHDDGKTPEAHMAMKQRMKGGPRRRSRA
jgi:hypothetical protein